MSNEVRPWDLILGEKIGREVAQFRLQNCMDCDRFNTLTKRCSECGCFMTAKIWLAEASCPLGKWGPEKKEK